MDPWGEGGRQGSAEEGGLEKDSEETKLFQKQPLPSPSWLLLGLQSFWRAQFAGPLQKERNLLIDISQAPHLDTADLDRS